MKNVQPILFLCEPLRKMQKTSDNNTEGIEKPKTKSLQRFR